MSDRRFETLVWAALIAAMIAVSAAFLVQRQRSAEMPPPLPVLGQVPAFSLTNQFGVLVDQDSVSGYVVVADIIFTRCPGQCHQMSQLMRRLQQRLPVGAPVRLVSLTADPVHDAPEALHRYGLRYGYEPATWLFLTGSKEAVYRLAIEGFRLSVSENPGPVIPERLDEMFLHSSAFVVVDRRGRLRGVVQLEDPDAEERLLNLVEGVLLLGDNP